MYVIVWNIFGGLQSLQLPSLRKRAEGGGETDTQSGLRETSSFNFCLPTFDSCGTIR